MKANFLAELRRDSGLSVVLFLQASIMFVVAPLAAGGHLSPMVLDLARFGLAAAAVLTLTRSRWRIFLIVGTFLASLVLSVAFRSADVAGAMYLVRIAVASAFDLAVAASVARVAFGPGVVSVHRIMGAVILYLSIGLVFANAYRAAALTLHPSFSGLAPDNRAALGELLYFSLGALTTSGSGDIAPLHPFVRSMSNLESVIGQLYPATLLGRLVTLNAAKHVQPEDNSG